MDSKTAEAGFPTSVETKIPRIPHDIINEILDHLATGSNFGTLQSCALVSKSWVPSCQRHLFHTITFTPEDMVRWLKTFPVPGEGPARHVRDLYLTIGGKPSSYPVAQKSFECILQFTNAERVTLSGRGGPRLQTPLWRPMLPQSITSLIIDTDMITLLQIRDIMTQLPNLDDLSLSDSPTVVGDTPQGTGAALRGRFGGKLQLNGHGACGGVIDMLLGVLTGLHFTEVEITSWSGCPLSAVSLAEACRKTLVKLSYAVLFSRSSGKPHPLHRPSWFQCVRCYS